MSYPGLNYVVPGANPFTAAVQSVGAGSNIIITGTPANPIVNCASIVTAVANQTGNVYLLGYGMTIDPDPLIPGDVIFTADVQNVTGTGGIVVTNPIPGTFQVAKPLFIGQYYKTTNQTGASGVTNVTFNAIQPWSNIGGYITHVSGTDDFVVVQTGLYQVEFALLVTGNGATWVSSKQASINIVRGVNNALLQQSTSVPSTNGYGIQVTGTLYLLAGDVINCLSVGNLTSGNVLINGLTNVFDYNTTFTWTFIN